MPFRVELRSADGDAPVAVLVTATIYSAALAAFQAVTRELIDGHVILLREREVLARFTPADGAASNGGTPPVASSADGCPKLSMRELEVLSHLLVGRTMKETARLLSITPRTVAFHKYKAMELNGLRNNAELISFAVRHGLLSARRAE
jgi:DNA-binding CsgD family transcriptional regulator